GHVDQVGVRQLALQLLDAALDEALLLARGVVLGVLLEVAVGAGLGDGGDHFRPLHRLEVVKLLAQALGALERHGGSHDCSSLCSSCSDQTGPVPRNSSECTSALAPAMVVE